jgi:hypothetical protein
MGPRTVISVVKTDLPHNTFFLWWRSTLKDHLIMGSLSGHHPSTHFTKKKMGAKKEKADILGEKKPESL